jgi:hypothetical protein
MKRNRDDVLFVVGVVLWVAVIVATWPRALSFVDEVGYVGRTKLLLEGHLSYVPGSPGVWLQTDRGRVGAYPLLQSLLLVPFAAFWPRAMFALGVSEAVFLAVLARSILKSWGKSPLWAGLVLAHPTIAILARTAMADLGLAAATLASWWALRRGRRVATVAWLAILVALKPAGAVLALAVVAGEALSSRAALRAREAAAWRRLGWGVAGSAAGLVLVVTGNLLSNGRAWFDLPRAHDGPLFELAALAHVAPLHAATVLAVPPLLGLGALAYWRRRELGPLVASAAFFAMMCVYYFVDVGLNVVETLVLAPRLLLPVVAFLLVGYAALLDDLAVRVGATRPAEGDVPPSPRPAEGDVPASPRPALAAVLFVLPLAVVAGVSVAHARAQRDMGIVRDVASAVADAHGEHMLGLTPFALKAGLLHEGPTRLYDPAGDRPAAVFCNEDWRSHRGSARATSRQPSCQLPGYHPINARGGFFALARDDAGGEAR